MSSSQARSRTGGFRPSRSPPRARPTARRRRRRSGSAPRPRGPRRRRRPGPQAPIALRSGRAAAARPRRSPMVAGTGRSGSSAWPGSRTSFPRAPARSRCERRRGGRGARPRCPAGRRARARRARLAAPAVAPPRRRWLRCRPWGQSTGRRALRVWARRGCRRPRSRRGSEGARRSGFERARRPPEIGSIGIRAHAGVPPRRAGGAVVTRDGEQRDNGDQGSSVQRVNLRRESRGWSSMRPCGRGAKTLLWGCTPKRSPRNDLHGVMERSERAPTWTFVATAP